MAGGYHIGQGRSKEKMSLLVDHFTMYRKLPKVVPRMLRAIDLTPEVGCVGEKVMVREGFLEEAAHEQR